MESDTETVKLLGFLRKRADLPRDEFVAWYEANHVPMIREVTPGLVDYRRNYLPETVGGADVITELTYANRAAFDHAMALASQSPVAERIADHLARSNYRIEEGPPAPGHGAGVIFSPPQSRRSD